MRLTERGRRPPARHSDEASSPTYPPVRGRGESRKVLLRGTTGLRPAAAARPESAGCEPPARRGEGAAARSRVHSKPRGRQNPASPRRPPAQSPSAPGVSSAPRGAACSRGGGGRGGLGQPPARRIGPGEQHPLLPTPPRSAQFNSHSAAATPCHRRRRRRPLGQPRAQQPGLGRGRERGGALQARGGARRRRRELQEPTCFAAAPRPSDGHHSARVTRTSANGRRAREKGRPGPDAPQEKATLPARGV